MASFPEALCGSLSVNTTLFGILYQAKLEDAGTHGLSDMIDVAGGRYWDRTSDLLGVNEALSR